VDISAKEVADSRDQLDAWLGHDEKGRDYIIGSADGLTILTWQWKYIEPNNAAAYNPLTHTELGNDRHDQLYDMVHDRGEYDNVATENPLIVRFLKEILQEEKSKGIGLSL
jgi:arylsulfatase A-like enzyme